MIVDGAMRDMPELAGMPFQVCTLRGQAAAVRPHLMSVDQVPVRIGEVTVVPGDVLLGESHGVLVIPAALAEEVVDAALEKDAFKDFQRRLLLEGRSIEGVYPPCSIAPARRNKTARTCSRYPIGVQNPSKTSPGYALWRKRGICKLLKAWSSQLGKLRFPGWPHHLA